MSIQGLPQKLLQDLQRESSGLIKTKYEGKQKQWSSSETELNIFWYLQRSVLNECEVPQWYNLSLSENNIKNLCLCNIVNCI